MKGTIVVAAVQGAVGEVLFALVGIQAAVFWGVAMGVLSLLPAVGSALVWVPAAVFLFATGAFWKGMLLAAGGTLVIGLVDNVLRPVLVGRETKMPDYLVLLATLGVRRSRFLLPFSLGALSMLVLVIAVTWAAPAVRGRLHSALRGGVATAPSASADEVPSVGIAPGETPSRAAPPDVAEPAADVGDAAKLLIPVQGVGAASLVDTYEQARGQGRRHDAIDIAAPRGTPVLAVADGAVMKLFRSERGGITLYQLAPDRRTVYYYAHLERYAPGMAEGRALRRGEVLGYVGDTGVATPGNYHLHFEVTTTADPERYWGGVPRNPYPLLR